MNPQAPWRRLTDTNNGVPLAGSLCLVMPWLTFVASQMLFRREDASCLATLGFWSCCVCIVCGDADMSEPTAWFIRLPTPGRSATFQDSTPDVQRSVPVDIAGLGSARVSVRRASTLSTRCPSLCAPGRCPAGATHLASLPAPEGQLALALLCR